MTNQHLFWNVSLKPLIVGFILSLLLVAGAYWLTQHSLFNQQALIGTVAILGTLQSIVQLICFLHLGIESKPRWNLLTFLLMSLIIVILVGGSLWIMDNLDYRMMPTMESVSTQPSRGQFK